MDKMNLRDGLKRLEAYFTGLDLACTFMEKSMLLPMDTLAVEINMEADLDFGIGINYIELADIGNLLQFYGQIELDDLLENEETEVSETEIMDLINQLNMILPIGQLIYMCDDKEKNKDKRVGIRYTTITDLAEDANLENCANIVILLMQAYEILCGSLLLMTDGASVEEAIYSIKQALIQA